MTGVIFVWVGCGRSGVLDQTEKRAGVGFHKIFTDNKKSTTWRCR